MIIINNYSKPIYILFDYNPLIKNFKLNETFFDKNSFIFILTSWYKTDQVAKIININREYNIIILANSLEEKAFFEKKVKSDVLFCNHNAFLDEKKYTIYNSIKKNYDLVIDSAFHEYKNVNIAKKIQNTIHIGYFNYKKINTHDKVVPNFGMLANFKSGEYKRLDKHSINIYYNQSLMGGMFSECEGACFASSQYLLSGLPVISIKSVGGRDIWYNEYNSIICENNEDSVYEAVELAKSKIVSGEFNREKIRELHLKQMDEHRNTLIEYISRLLLNDEEGNIDINDIKNRMAFF
jgi:Iap family predicted aminopeptidase